MLSLYMPDVGLKLHELSDPHPADLVATDLLVDDGTIETAKFSTRDLM